MKAAKQRAMKARVRKRQQKLEEEAKLLENAHRLKTMQGGFALHGSKPKNPMKILRDFKAPKIIRREEVQPKLPATPDPIPDLRKPQMHLRYSDEMLAREKAAQEIIKEKKKLAMPLYNKGPAQYPTEEDMAAAKRGELKRR